MADLTSPADDEPVVALAWAALPSPETASAVGSSAARIYLDVNRLKYGALIPPGGRLIAFPPV